MTLELIKCPFCGYKFRMDVEEVVKEGEVVVARGLLDFLKKKPEKSMKTDAKLCIKCPNCGQILDFKYMSVDEGNSFSVR